MISKLQIENFQTHERTRLEFDKLTTIVGPADVGKSSIVRALRWLLTNKPRGESFVRYGSNSVAVRAVIDGRKLSRIKNSEGNAYKLDSQEFKAFGSDVPETVSNLVNIDDNNIQLQHDSPFWFNLTSGEVAKRINDIVDLSVIDESLSFIASKSRKVNAEVSVCQERLEQAELDKEKLSFVPDLVSRYEKLQEEDKELDELGKSIDELEDLLERIDEAKRLADCKLPSIDELQDLFDGIREEERELGELENLIQETEIIGAELKVQKKELAGVQEQLDSVDVCPLCERKMNA